MKNRGFMLILVLLLTILMVSLGLGLIGKQAANYRAAKLAVRMAQARALAEAGMEDARLKFERDPFFPFPTGDEQNVFSYEEDVTSLASAARVGSYRVNIDKVLRKDPYNMAVVCSIGTVGPLDDPDARFVIRAELDLFTREYRTWEEGADPVFVPPP